MMLDLVDQFEAAEDEVIENIGEEFVTDNILALRQRVRPIYDSVYHQIMLIFEGVDSAETVEAEGVHAPLTNDDLCSIQRPKMPPGL